MTIAAGEVGEDKSNSIVNLPDVSDDNTNQTDNVKPSDQPIAVKSLDDVKTVSYGQKNKANLPPKSGKDYASDHEGPAKGAVTADESLEILSPSRAKQQPINSPQRGQANITSKNIV